MKKLIIVLASLMLLVGCGNHYSTVTDADEVIFSYPNGDTYTKGNLYTDMKGNDITSICYNAIVMRIAEKEGIDIDTIKSDIQETIDEMTGNGMDAYITYYYGSVDAYKEAMISSQVEVDLCSKDIENNFETYKEDYDAFQAEMVYFDDEETANNLVTKATETNQTFAYISTEEGYENAVTTTIYSNKDSLADAITDYVNNNEPGVSPVIAVDEVTTDSDGNSVTNTKYYVINLISKNADDFKDDFIDYVLNDVDMDTIIANYINKYDINIYDQRVYELLSSNYEVLK